VWVDANHDGQSFIDTNHNNVLDAGEATELKTLTELGITQINLTATAQSGAVSGGNEILASGSYSLWVDAASNPVAAGTAGAVLVNREAIAANFLANPNGHSFLTAETGTLVSTQGSGLAPATSAYVAGNAAGEVIDVALKGVSNAYGAAGADTLLGDAGNDYLMAGPGDDRLFGGGGNDMLTAAALLPVDAARFGRDAVYFGAGIQKDRSYARTVNIHQ
jgi:Ca2+-binding RTX toxin-like protein